MLAGAGVSSSPGEAGGAPTWAGATGKGGRTSCKGWKQKDVQRGWAQECPLQGPRHFGLSTPQSQQLPGLKAEDPHPGYNQKKRSKWRTPKKNVGHHKIKAIGSQAKSQPIQKRQTSIWVDLCLAVNLGETPHISFPSPPKINRPLLIFRCVLPGKLPFPGSFCAVWTWPGAPGEGTQKKHFSKKHTLESFRNISRGQLGGGAACFTRGLCLWHMKHSCCHVLGLSS